MFGDGAADWAMRRGVEMTELPPNKKTFTNQCSVIANSNGFGAMQIDDIHGGNAGGLTSAYKLFVAIPRTNGS